jgi:LPS export ABC transporter protein LptC
MMFKRIVLFIGLILIAFFILHTQKQPKHEKQEINEPQQQQINEFSLAGYGEKGKKAWDISGKSADIFTDVVKLNAVEGNLYRDEENIKLNANRGDFNKTDATVRLEQDVVITTGTGAKLTTDSLEWDRKMQLVSTPDTVNINKGNMSVVARGAMGESNLKRVALEKDVRLDINPQDPAQDGEGAIKEKITITCEGPLVIDYGNNIANFNKNVKVERQDSVILCDKMDVYFIASKKETKEPKEADADKKDKPSALMGNKIDMIVAQGNVRVIRGDNVSYSKEAIYSASDRKITLRGKPELVIYSAEDIKDASFRD